MLELSNTDRSIWASLAEGVVVQDAAGLIRACNNSAYSILGLTEDQLLGRSSLDPDWRAIHEDGSPFPGATHPAMQTLSSGQPCRNVVMGVHKPDGVLTWISINSQPLGFDEQKRLIGVVTSFVDITVIKNQELALQKVNRTLRVLSTVNITLVRADGELKLLAEVCQSLVSSGGYQIAFIGYPENDPRKTVRTMAHADHGSEYLEQVRISWADDALGHGPTGTAIRTGETSICRNFATDPNMAPWRDAALKVGIRSSIALPLKNPSGLLGALTLYSSQTDAFDADEVNLLQELAEDLTLGIVNQRVRLEHRRAEEAVHRLAYFDALTGLPNNVQVVARLEALISGKQSSRLRVAVMSVDVRHFRELRDGLGIGQADELLQQIAARLRAALEDDCFLARVGTDVFAILIADADAEDVARIAARVHEAMGAPFPIAGVMIDAPVSIGAAVYPDHGSDPHTLLVHSDIAVRDAKRADVICALYSGRTEQESPDRLALIGELRRAIQENQLLLEYQPKVDVQNRRVSGVEALIRWQHPVRGRLGPNLFISLAEHTGLIKLLTYWVIEAAMEQLSAWQRQGRNVPVAVNVSAHNLRDPDFFDRIQTLRSKWNIPAGQLEFEITESAVMEDPAKSRDILARLGAAGHRIFIDDFGTEYSSLKYIATLPIHALKIDKSFVDHLLEGREHRSVIAATISLAHSLRLHVVAEGIESVDQAKALIELKCDEIQGFLFARPMAPHDLERWHCTFSMDQHSL